MNYLAWVFFGLIAGVLAKSIMPGKDPGGIIVTILIGIAGSFLAGFLGKLIGIGGAGVFDIRGIVLSTGGAIVLLIVYRLVMKAKKPQPWRDTLRRVPDLAGGGGAERDARRLRATFAHQSRGHDGACPSTWRI
jgi:uncharacterized membrane protein YeaQ/YmgE (transglycosylase-associated protein family)